MMEEERGGTKSRRNEEEEEGNGTLAPSYHFPRSPSILNLCARARVCTYFVWPM